MWNDPIVEEVRRIREEHAAQFDYDIDAIFADYKRLEAESKRPHVAFGPRRTSKPVLSAEPTPATSVNSRVGGGHARLPGAPFCAGRTSISTEPRASEGVQ